MTRQAKVIRLEANGPQGAGLTPLELDPEDFQSPLPVQHYHQYYADEEFGIAVGVWDTTTMQEAFGPYPGDEFIVVLQGAFAMVDGKGGAVAAHKGQSVCFRNAIPTSWKQDGYLKKFYLTWNDPESNTPKITSSEGGVLVLEPHATLPSGVAGEQLVFTNDAGNMKVSLCESGALQTTLKPARVHELVQMLEGAVTIAEADGASQSFAKGDVFFIPKGTICSWMIDHHLATYQVRLSTPT